MPTYRYSGYNRNGLTCNGTTTATSEVEATATLESKGIIIGELWIDNRLKSRRQIPSEQLIRICEHLAMLLQTGFSAPAAIEYVAKETRSAFQRDILTEIARAVTTGASLADAMQTSNIMPPTYISMLLASEKVNRTAETLESIATDLKDRRDFQVKLRKALAYPLFLFGAALGVGIIFLFTIFPTIADIYRQSNLPSPFIFVAADYAQIVLAYAAWTFLLTPLLLLPRVRAAAVAFLYSGALRIGPITHLRNLLQLRNFLSVLAISASSGASVKSAFRSARQVVDDQAEYYDSVVRQVMQGLPILALSNNKSYLHVAFQLVDLGMQTNRLGQSAEQAKRYVEQEIQRRTDTIAAFAGPTATLLIGLLVGAMAYAMTSALSTVNEAGMNL